ncbi:hypothetical protein SAMN04489752_0221 [Brevibacterium siliguriense]|uniref:Uncharacterized protein n=1 Tax=Brevibacterium siliguriense TaxID=1136497 RepID=A0A1H1LUQ4_9MICO|nr:hypothetical protein [Brevibacterium siliguriense]SDR77489.1 hypothetical protein SAMN04489752_0221 [Brevibacterium siliguriense]
MSDTNVPSLAELFGPNPPTNWGRWGTGQLSRHSVTVSAVAAET